MKKQRGNYHRILFNFMIFMTMKNKKERLVLTFSDKLLHLKVDT